MVSDTNSANEGSSPASANSEGSSRAGWFLLGGAALLAAGSIGYNVYEGEAEPVVEQLTSGDELPSMDDLRAAAEGSSGDAGAWASLAFAHFERGEFDLAVNAYERAVAIDDGAGDLWSALGEARVMAVDAALAAADPLPDSAIDAFEKALERDPGNPRARYFLAVKRDLEGDHEGAISDWLALLADTPPGAPWESDVVRTIQQVGAIHDITVDDRITTVVEARSRDMVVPGSGAVAGEGASSNLRGPTAQQVADARNMTPGQQEQMVAGMVASLEARLQDEPNNLDGWVMLMRSRMTLGETGKARQALEDAVAANPANAAQLRDQAAQLGIR